MAWRLAGTPSTGGGGDGIWDHAGDVANVDFTGLAGWSEVMVLCRNIVLGTTGLRSVRVSTDNGSSFLTASGDYISVASTGVESNEDGIAAHVTNATAARTGVVVIRAWNQTNNKIASRQTRVDVDTTLIPTGSALNALRVYGSGGGNLTGGSIRVYAR